MLALILIIAMFAAVVWLPGWWVQQVLERHRRPANRYPGTGGELARHLLDRAGLDAVRVEQSRDGDHYDPDARCIRLRPENYAERSLTAITVAAHEVGHAIQHADGYGPLLWRTRLVKTAARVQRIGAVLMLLMPLALIALKVPRVGLVMLAVGLAALASGVVIHLVTLPVELDASFRRALPILERGGYLKAEDRPAARRILTAAALTYVAASLAGLFNFMWWLRMLRP
ncbi:MAG: zinc metallopeptidase [Wenzhouxiangellaceae bacterium]